MRYSMSIAALPLTMLMAGSSFAASFVLCQAPDKEDIVIEQDAEKFGEHSLTCISGGGFVVDMTPCAPDGGFGLSAPTGSASLVGVVTRWQDYGDHSGGVVAYSESASSLSFHAGFHYPGSGYQDAWSFEVSRLTGKGELAIVQEVEEDGAVGWSYDEYACKPASQKF